ncbi:MAG TPA: polysaccharide deacetylase family protein [Pseudomonadota bacterium]|nr:polysaccharide deacetylase family protein [Pseudomonadota bacterium]
MRVLVTIDMEQDCPPYLSSFQGVQDGAPRVLSLLHRLGIHGTFFTTGDVARRFPKVIERIVSEGHELGCHGDTHQRFGRMTASEANQEIVDASATLRSFGKVVSFRAPNLDFPNEFLSILQDNGYRVDSSYGRHKPGTFFSEPTRVGDIVRIPASVAPSWLRIPRVLRNALLSQLRDPAVFFFHPWEFVDATGWDIPIDCRYRTGDPALDSLAATVEFFRNRSATFHTMSQLAA